MLGGLLLNKSCEVLSPVGSMDVLKSAVFSGADCVYLSGKNYGARDFADNFTYDEIEEAIEFCHNFNVKVYVTVNISILEREIVDVVDYVYFLYSQGVDAVIIQDVGLGHIISSLIPNLELHASTQMTIYDYSFVKWLYENGFNCANISREVPINRVGNITSKLRKFNNDMQIEVFAHGALCYCYSGRCLMSSFLGGRSGNRGLCAQPCRMRYTVLDKYHGAVSDDNYILSTNDLCTYNDIKKITDADVDCIKIEGRLKSSQYVSATTYCYKNAINGNINREDNLLLNLAFNRGLTNGYILDSPADDVVGRNNPGSAGYPIGYVSKSNPKQITIKLLNKDHPIKFVNGDGIKFEYADKSYGMYISKIYSQSKYKLIISNPKNIYLNEDTLVYITYSKYLEDRTKEIINEKHINKIPLNLEISINNQRQLEVKCSLEKLQKTFTFTSEERFEKAKNRPLTKENINNQLRKTGKSKFTIRNITYANFYDDLFMPISSLNNIRRELLKNVKNNIESLYLPDKKELKTIKDNIDAFKKTHYSKNTPRQEHKTWNAYIHDIKQAEIIKEYPFIDNVYFDASYNYENMHEYTRDIYDQIVNLNRILPDRQIIWVLPQLLLDKDLPHINEILVKLEYDNIPVKIQTDNIAIAANLEVESYGNYMNIYNNYSIEKLSQNNLFKRLVISNEISMNDVKRLYGEECDLEYIIFGYNQLMISKDDFNDIISGSHIDNYYLKDKRNNEFKLEFDCNDNSHIYDYRIINLENRLDEFDNSNINSLSIDLRHFNPNDSEKILEHFSNIVSKDNPEKLDLMENNPFYEGNIEKGLYVNNNK